MGFDLKQQHTANAIKLAQKFWDFLTLNVGKRFDTRWYDKQISQWAGTFDTLLLHENFNHICDLFDYYVAEWESKRKQNEKPYTYCSPDAFIGDLYFLEQRYEWNTRPIPEEELREFLIPLGREHWICSWDSLVTAVSKSVFAVRSFLAGLGRANISGSFKYKIRALFGDSRGYVIRHFLSWRKHQIEAVWTATITMNSLFEFVQKFMLRCGYSDSLRKQCINLIKAGVYGGTSNDNNRHRSGQIGSVSSSFPR